MTQKPCWVTQTDSNRCSHPFCSIGILTNEKPLIPIEKSGQVRSRWSLWQVRDLIWIILKVVVLSKSCRSCWKLKSFGYDCGDGWQVGPWAGGWSKTESRIEKMWTWIFNERRDLEEKWKEIIWKPKPKDIRKEKKDPKRESRHVVTSQMASGAHAAGLNEVGLKDLKDELRLEIFFNSEISLFGFFWAFLSIFLFFSLCSRLRGPVLTLIFQVSKVLRQVNEEKSRQQVGKTEEKSKRKRKWS